MTTVTGFLSIAGAALTTIGAITGKKDLTRIGGFMGLAGGIGQAFNAATAASTAGQSAEQAAFLAANEPVGNAGAVAAAEAAAPTVSAAQNLGVGVDAEVAKAAAGVSEAPLMGRAAEVASAAPSNASLIPNTQPTSSLNAMQLADIQPNVFADRLAAGAAGIESPSQLQSLLKLAGDKAGSALSATSQWMAKNPELVKIGGSALESMYGPKAEAFDYDRSIYERRLRNLNAPVRLGVLQSGG